MDLLSKRTSGIAQQTIDQISEIQYESSPSLALAIVWDSLDKRFDNHQLPSQRLLQDLVQGPAITTNWQGIFMFAQNCMLLTFALTLDRESSLLNTEINSKKVEVAGVCFVAFLLGLSLKAYYYYCLHPWPTFRGTMCTDLKETLRNLSQDGNKSIMENIPRS